MLLSLCLYLVCVSVCPYPFLRATLDEEDASQCGRPAWSVENNL